MKRRTDPAYLAWVRRWNEYATLRNLVRREYLRSLKEIAREYPEDSLRMPPEPAATVAERLLAEVEEF